MAKLDVSEGTNDCPGFAKETILGSTSNKRRHYFRIDPSIDCCIAIQVFFLLQQLTSLDRDECQANLS